MVARFQAWRVLSHVIFLRMVEDILRRYDTTLLKAQTYDGVYSLLCIYEADVRVIQVLSKFGF